MKLPTSKIICKNIYVHSDSKNSMKVKNPQKEICWDYILILIQKIQAHNSPYWEYEKGTINNITELTV
jgi:hypothetical protein